MGRIVLATNNAGKLRELQALLQPLALELIPKSQFTQDEVAETGATFVANALIKARHAAAIRVSKWMHWAARPAFFRRVMRAMLPVMPTTYTNCCVTWLKCRVRCAPLAIAVWWCMCDGQRTLSPSFAKQCGKELLPTSHEVAAASATIQFSMCLH